MKNNNKITKELGKIIKEERKSHKMTQQELADFAGTGINLISELERGRSTVRFDKVLDVIKVFGLSFKLIYSKKDSLK